MGDEIKSAFFSQADFDEFNRNLKIETRLLKQWFKDGMFAVKSPSAGFELEAWLIDKEFHPAAINETFLKELSNSLVVPELSQFNVEINSTPHSLKGNCFSKLYDELKTTWNKCHNCANKMDSEMAMIGILPTLKQNMLTLKHMSRMQRYRALNEQIFRLRQGHAMVLDIKGKDHLITSHDDVMFESAGTSLQLHYQVDQQMALRVYNASLILSAPMVAVAANSPFLFENDLWDETRIPLFEQAVALGCVQNTRMGELRRVTFGSGYIKESLYECFLENLVYYPILLPSTFQQEASQMRHLSLHNGTIWRWNRPLIHIGPNGLVNMRIEHRVTSAGPTLTDIIANAALYFGLTYQLAIQETPPESRLSFEETRNNFYLAAREGLNARIKWIDGNIVSIQALLLNKLIPEARKGLHSLGVDKDDISTYLDSVITERVRTQQNGAYWQRQFIKKHKKDFVGLTKAYVERQQQGDPVHTWNL
jgi:hypothetical protein